MLSRLHNSTVRPLCKHVAEVKEVQSTRQCTRYRHEDRRLADDARKLSHGVPTNKAGPRVCYCANPLVSVHTPLSSTWAKL